MTLLDQFILREKLGRSLAAADACLARAKAAVAVIEACGEEFAAQFEEARGHYEALRAPAQRGAKESAN